VRIVARLLMRLLGRVFPTDTVERDAWRIAAAMYAVPAGGRLAAAVLTPDDPDLPKE
jgi:hypothetical protein